MRWIWCWLFVIVVAITPSFAIAQSKKKKKSPKKEKFVVKWIESPHWHKRSENDKIDTIVLHHTELNLDRTLEHFYRPESGVSAHFVVAKDGTIYHMVRLENVAYHAGVSVDPLGRSDVNSRSIGIEIVNDGDGRDPYPAKQIESVIKLIKFANQTGAIKFILSHEYVAEPIGRKNDPKGFPWSKLESLSIPLYYGKRSATPSGAGRSQGR